MSWWVARSCGLHAATSRGSWQAGVVGQQTHPPTHPPTQVVQAYLGVKLGVWSYNRTVKHWEPAMEPWDVIVKCDANYGTQVGMPMPSPKAPSGGSC